MKYTKLWFLSVTLLIEGCAVGYNTTLFMTKSNIGLDVETKPPTAEISIARREGVIAPGFEGGQTPPVLSSFRSNLSPFDRFFLGVQSTFAGGDAAVALSQKQADANDNQISAACLSQKPNPQTFLWADVSIPEKGEVRPFIFGTDTSFGLKVAWSGMTGQIPDTVRLGFNRKEFAWAPVFGTDAVSCIVPGTQQPGTYAISMPSFLAVLDNDVQLGTPTQTKVKWLQYIATGKSATTLASDEKVRNIMMERIDPVTYQSVTVDFNDPSVICVDDWLNANPANQAELVKWWNENKLPSPATGHIKSPKYSKERTEFIRLENIENCSK